ncbi:MAG TPA: hypothetical protein VNW90_10665 [Acetobacteraceae bacterium]|nr:hypothetical protein [Acetobacteraceae bacterium]
MAGSARIVWPELWHPAALVARMTPRDLAAFAALGCPDAEAAIRTGVRASTYAWSAMEDDEPLCIGGIIPSSTMLGDTALPWMVSQPGLGRHKRFFLRESRARLPDLRRQFPILANVIACDYPKSLRWLAWLGFEIGDEAAGVRLVRLG